MEMLAEIITKTQIQGQFSTLKHNIHLLDKKKIIIYKEFSIILCQFENQRTPLKFGSSVTQSDSFFWL